LQDKEDNKPNSVPNLTSRVTIIYLDQASPHPVYCLDSPVISGDWFERSTRGLYEWSVSTLLFDLAPNKVYQAFSITRETGGLLHHLFTLIRRWADGLFSVALSFPHRNLASTRCYAPRCSDFPLR